MNKSADLYLPDIKQNTDIKYENTENIKEQRNIKQMVEKFEKQFVQSIDSNNTN